MKKRSEPSRYWGCTKKVLYASWEAAEAASLKLMDESPTVFPVMAYRCYWQDHGFHIGHSPHVARSHANNPDRRIGYMAQTLKAPALGRAGAGNGNPLPTEPVRCEHRDGFSSPLEVYPQPTTGGVPTP